MKDFQLYVEFCKKKIVIINEKVSTNIPNNKSFLSNNLLQKIKLLNMQTPLGRKHYIFAVCVKRIIDQNNLSSVLF